MFKKIISLFVFLVLLLILERYSSLLQKKFTVIVLPDTQYYSENNPEFFCEQINWILKNKESLSILFVSHMGDIVQNGGLNLYEWDRASTCMKKLDNVIPYAIIPGNHDSDIPHQKESGFKIFNTYFPPKNENHYIGNENNYQIIDTFNKKILFLNLSIEPNDEEIAWAQNILNQHKDIYTILTTHKYLHDYDMQRSQENSYSTKGNSGEKIWNKLIYINCNIKMVWSGHYHADDGENMRISKNICNEDVYQIVQDYQSREKGGNGLLRIYTFKKNIIEVTTYSPITNSYEHDNDSQFILKY